MSPLPSGNSIAMKATLKILMFGIVSIFLSPSVFGQKQLDSVVTYLYNTEQDSFASVKIIHEYYPDGKKAFLSRYHWDSQLRKWVGSMFPVEPPGDIMDPPTKGANV